MTENTRTAAQVRESLLAVVVGHGDLMAEPETRDGLPMYLNIEVTVYAYMAHRFLAALEQHATPEAVAAILADLQETLDDGALPEYAYDEAVTAGFDPEPWGPKRVAWARKVFAPRDSEARS